ncbi:MAG: hypothetical protein O7C63_02080, partial [Alphaproteobacteria bacterium]|nr:hypothetical protein [Alphaproteobacteria bacterium]
MTRQTENDIKGSPNGDDHAAQIEPRPKWPFWIGTGGRFPSESVAVFIRIRIRDYWNQYVNDIEVCKSPIGT